MSFEIFWLFLLLAIVFIPALVLTELGLSGWAVLRKAGSTYWQRWRQAHRYFFKTWLGLTVVVLSIFWWVMCTPESVPDSDFKLTTGMDLPDDAELITTQSPGPPIMAAFNSDYYAEFEAILKPADRDRLLTRLLNDTTYHLLMPELLPSPIALKAALEDEAGDSVLLTPGDPNYLQPPYIRPTNAAILAAQHLHFTKTEGHIEVKDIRIDRRSDTVKLSYLND